MTKLTVSSVNTDENSGISRLCHFRRSVCASRFGLRSAARIGVTKQRLHFGCLLVPTPTENGVFDARWSQMKLDLHRELLSFGDAGSATRFLAKSFMKFG